MDRDPLVYILASRFRGTIYIGVTSDLMARISEHRSGVKSGFAGRYKVHRLVHYEQFADMDSAIAREKQLKRWHRQWKVNLIEEKNPDWAEPHQSLSHCTSVDVRPPTPQPCKSLDPETSSG